MASHPEGIEMKHWPVASELNPGPLKTLLHKLGLEKQYPNQLTLRSLLEINKDSISDDAVDSLKAVPRYFLRKLLIVNADCRSCTCLPEDESSIDLYRDEDNEVNLLDLITALFLCADSFLQQEMALKMSMCQFAVPLLLPPGTGSQSTLMLWALRAILKEWRPHALSESKGFEEGNIVFEQMPFISFVRLQDCSMSKSQLLNNIFSSGQQIHNIFAHKDMDGGAAPRTISGGLVEACWYLPCGSRNGDTFPEPLTVANLRGDICASQAQFSFLTQVSTAIFIFLDSVDEDERKLLLSLGDMGSKLFFVVNSKEEVSRNVRTSVKEIMDAFKLKSNKLLMQRPNVNRARFSRQITKAMNDILKESTSKISIESMSNKAIELGLSVDECKTEASKSAEEILKGIGDQSIVNYKRYQLPLQGEHWKQLAKIEKEECRLKDSGETRLEEYKAKLQEDKLKIRREQNKYKTTTAMASFLGFLATTDKEEKALFLKWLQFKLDMWSRKDLSSLRNRFKEQSLVKQDNTCLEELDQCLLDSSLGIEHFMREMGQIYEASRLGNPQASSEHCSLPALAAELLLDGYPFELLDGDASNIPEKWVTDVLMELHRKVGEKSKLLVLTVLGVQSTGKSTLLNTMFGVQFPVSSGRCTRGAFMLFLRVGEDMRKDLRCDFIILIDTEGLKSPSLAQLDESCEHDNELATLVIGLSDITIINVAMENSTEMNDVLQIVVHAFLRMKEVGKKPVCHFVYQNVAGVSAHNKNVTDRKYILDRLNEMTQIAAEMEKRPSVNRFTDVLDYDADKNNWYIPGLWHGTPPMAPVNTGYSEAVFDLKKNLLEVLKICRYEEPSQIPEFTEWMKSLWKAVKYENFIFSFRNTLVAQAYDNLWKEMTQWEWESRKKIYTWQTKADLQISNLEANSFEKQAEIQDLQKLEESLKSEALKMVVTLEKEMTEELDAYYKRKDRNVSLIEKNKIDFFHHIRDVHRDILNTENNKLDMAVKLKISTIEADDIHRKQKVIIEQKVLQLRQNSSDSKTPLSDEQLEDEFGKMWSREVVKISDLEEQDIPSFVFKQLRGDFSNRNVNEELQNAKNLTAYGKEPFKAKSRHICTMTKLKRMFAIKKVKQNVQRFSESVNDTCTRFILDSAKSQTDYHDTLTKEVLQKINESLKENLKDLKTNTKFEVDLKLHICGIASREFLQMHRNFLLRNDPKKRLEESRNQYFSDFIDLYRERDHCQRKAQDFVQHGLRPAILQYINGFLGTDIVDEMVKSSHAAEYSSRSSFQYSILKELLEKDDFQAFVKYFEKYEIYVKDLICQHIKECFSAEMSFVMLKTKRLKEIIQKIMEAIEKASQPLPNDTKSVTEFMKNLCKHLVKDICISMDAVEVVLFQISTTCDPFTTSLHESLSDLKQQMQDEFSKSIDIIESLYTLPIKPQDELFMRVSGCTKQCPFCKMPCDAGGKDHRQHYANAHRPQALGSYRSFQTQELVETLCTTDVNGERSFINTDTDSKPHPYKDYRSYYPEWNIQPDSTDEASDYWKYVLATYNDRLAGEYNAKPAVIPEAWKTITKAQALEGLKVAFSIKV
ncbi:up-regulator of cell proliferation-like [Salvelinus fontinalis]|uniref:up-regulator of cell proliferation-like n=1 Tax=Salvelinus fontinalis TaxID=8038 RepID=UPI0024866983|nr:up-regulator of cell proliferation-like [Salvelinus fontinalis]XP_055743552.1 up-regulator of cell proliferation-like [Salvelinus fontinalis]